jgi:hypothetical protein
MFLATVFVGRLRLVVCDLGLARRRRTLEADAADDAFSDVLVVFAAFRVAIQAVLHVDIRRMRGAFLVPKLYR